MVNLELSGVNEIEIVSTALFEYHTAMTKAGNISRAAKVLDILDRINLCL